MLLENLAPYGICFMLPHAKMIVIPLPTIPDHTWLDESAFKEAENTVQSISA